MASHPASEASLDAMHTHSANKARAAVALGMCSGAVGVRDNNRKDARHTATRIRVAKFGG